MYLDASSDEEEEPEAAVTEPAAAAGSSHEQSAVSIYSMAAEPFRALVACITDPPGVPYKQQLCNRVTLMCS